MGRPGAQWADAESGSFGLLVGLWHRARGPVVAPILQVAVDACLVMVLMMFAERVYMCAVVVAVRACGRRLRPAIRYRFRPLADDISDLESSSPSFPKILVQIPMFNEKEVRKSQSFIAIAIAIVNRNSNPSPLLNCSMFCAL
jgi:beta-mannan synthase